jgi:hypothetical protein
VGLKRSGLAFGRLDVRGGGPGLSVLLHMRTTVDAAVHTIVVSHLQLRKVVPKHPIVCVVAVVVGRSALLRRLANAIKLFRLRRAKVLPLRPRLARPLLVAVDRVAISIVLVWLAVAVQLLGEVGDPARDRLLRLLEALLNVLADFGQVIWIQSAKLCSQQERERTIEEAVLAVGFVRSLTGLLPALALAGTAALALVVFCELSCVYLVLFKLRTLRPRRLWRRGFFSFEVGVRHACHN